MKGETLIQALCVYETRTIDTASLNASLTVDLILSSLNEAELGAETRAANSKTPLIEMWWVRPSIKAISCLR